MSTKVKKFHVGFLIGIDKMKHISMPPLWDLHIHGVAGLDFMTLSTPHDFVEACLVLGAQGIGLFAPTLLTDHPQKFLTACTQWGRFFEILKNHKNFLPQSAAVPLGLHLEGPFLNPKAAGAHDPQHLKLPSQNLFAKFWRASQGHIALVTLAPELPGALTLIRLLTRQGVRVQLGHSLASLPVTQKAFAAGAQGLTHLFNAMGFHHRNPGLVTSLLTSDVCTAELITDGLHVAPPLVLWTAQSFPQKIYAVSDGCAATGCKSGTTPLTLGSLKITKQKDTAVVTRTQTLAGGATFLSEHPARLYKELSKLGTNPSILQKQILSLFRPPRCLHLQKYMRIHNVVSRIKRVHFHPKTLKFLGVDI